MKIVYINTVCHTGSTGRITVDLYHLAEQNNFIPFIAYGRNYAPKNLRSFKISNKADFYCHVATNFLTGRNGYASKKATQHFLMWLDSISPDVLHLHNIHGFYLHVGMLFEYIKQHSIPVIWTLHDCWAFTGHCAYFDYINCHKWESQCESCTIHRTTYPYSIFKDNSFYNYKKKKEDFMGVPELTLVTPSYWLADLLKSSFLKEYPIKVIPNGIDLNVFKPLAPKQEDGIYNILGVANVWSERKGLAAFLKLADMLDETYHITLVGLSKKQCKDINRKFHGKITPLCRTHNLTELVELYNNAFVYVNPTLEDNFPTTNLEALACGTPVITYKTGGSPEAIDSSCGIIVEKGNILQLYQSILALHTNTNITAESCRKKAFCYDKNLRFMEYFQLYNTVINSSTLE